MASETTPAIRAATAVGLGCCVTGSVDIVVSGTFGTGSYSRFSALAIRSQSFEVAGPGPVFIHARHETWWNDDPKGMSRSLRQFRGL